MSSYCTPMGVLPASANQHMRKKSQVVALFTAIRTVEIVACVELTCIQTCQNELLCNYFIIYSLLKAVKK